MSEIGFDEEVDVAVVGCGYAGAVAAISAHDVGARVAIFEKADEPGGISVCSFGGVRVASDAAAALAYLRRTNRDTAPDDVLAALAAGMVDLPARVAALAQRVGATTVTRPSPANYAFAGHDTFGFVDIDTLADFTPQSAYPHVQGAPGGMRLFEVLVRNLRLRNLQPRCGARAVELLTDRHDGVIGLVLSEAGQARRIRARGGVVLACGGFEGDTAMQRQFWPEGPVLNAAYRGNTGDGIRLAQSVGADLWHMWHYHGSYGFRHPDPAYPFGIRTKRLPDWRPDAAPEVEVRMPWILVDRRGRRFMNEYDPYLQDTGARPFARYDPQAQDFANIPAWLIADADGARLWPFGRPTWHEAGIGFDWGPDNERAIVAGILRQADSLAAIAADARLPVDALAATIARWNQNVAAGEDADCQRPPASMAPVRKPPFLHAPVWPIVSNTQGGPVHDAGQRVLRPNGRPIIGLYAAGELGSVFGHLYLSGGNIAECFVGGRLAGEAAAQRSSP